MTDERCYPRRPVLAVSAAIFRGDKALLVRRARAPARGLFTLPGGAVEAGETLREALLREALEETGLAIEPVALVAHREVIDRDGEGRVERHFVILAFAARWLGGEPVFSAEIDECRWLEPEAIAALAANDPTLPTTEGLAPIVAAARLALSREPD